MMAALSRSTVVGAPLWVKRMRVSSMRPVLCAPCLTIVSFHP